MAEDHVHGNPEPAGDVEAAGPEIEVVPLHDTGPEAVVKVTADALPMQVTIGAPTWPTVVIELGDTPGGERSIAISPPSLIAPAGRSFIRVDVAEDDVELRFGASDSDVGYAGTVRWDSIVGDRIVLESETMYAAPPVTSSCVHGISPFGTHCSILPR
jgi:hypothetical protein